MFQEQAPSCVVKFALRERVSGASSLVCTGWGTYPGACFGSVFQEQASSCVLVGVLTRERVSRASPLVCTGLNATVHSVDSDILRSDSSSWSFQDIQ